MASEGVQAAEVLAEAYDQWENHPKGMPGPVQPYLVAALLAHGEHGIAVTPDGQVWALEPTPGATFDGKSYHQTVRLVPPTAQKENQ